MTISFVRGAIFPLRSRSRTVRRGSSLESNLDTSASWRAYRFHLDAAGPSRGTLTSRKSTRPKAPTSFWKHMVRNVLWILGAEGSYLNIGP